MTTSILKATVTLANPLMLVPRFFIMYIPYNTRATTSCYRVCLVVDYRLHVTRTATVAT